MRKFIVLIVAAFMATVNTNAQDEWKNEISIAYGAGSNTDLVGSIYKGIFTGKQLSYWGPISAEYFYRPVTNLGVGTIAGIGGCKWDDEDNAKSTFITIMPAVKYNWLNKSHFSMYSKVALGLTVSSDSGLKEDKTKMIFNWQASLIGMEFGNAFRGFVEFGTGEQGILIAGLRYKF